MRRAVSAGTIAVGLVLATTAYAAVITCDGGPCQGTDEADTITGDKQGDNIFADSGPDNVDARTGHDFVRGAEGDDEISGGGGLDTLRGHRGGDTIQGGFGDDFIFGHDNPDEPPIGGVSASGSPGPSASEELNDTAGNDADAVYGGAGFELISVADGDGDDYVDCGPDGAYVSSDKGDKLDNCFLVGPGS
jgi:hypothetical protein